MSSLTVPAPSAAPAKPDPGLDREPGPFEPLVHGESTYDRVTSMLMSIIIGAALAVFWIAVILMTIQAYNVPATQPMEVVEYDNAGGNPDADPNANGGDQAPQDAQQSANTEEAASDFQEPAIQEQTTVIDAMASEPVAESEIEMNSTMLEGGAEANKKKGSRLGTGGVFGEGNGTGGGFSRERRWTIIFSAGQSLEEYARQLDFLGIELATVATKTTLDYASSFSAGAPRRRSGGSRDDKRLYFAWQGKGRSGTDIALMQRAGINVGDKPILQFCPAPLENKMATLERAYKGRQPTEIRTTRFSVVQKGGSYDLVVLSQDPLR